MTHDAPTTRTRWSSAENIAAQWAGLLGAPILWLAQFELRYALVTPACKQGSTLALHLVSVISLALMAGLALLAWRAYRSGTGPLDGAHPPARARFLGLVGLWSCALFGLVTLAQWMPVFFQNPCYE